MQATLPAAHVLLAVADDVVDDLTVLAFVLVVLDLVNFVDLPFLVVMRVLAVEVAGLETATDAEDVEVDVELAAAEEELVAVVVELLVVDAEAAESLLAAARSFDGHPLAGRTIGYCDVAEATAFLVEGSLVVRYSPGFGNFKFCMAVVPHVLGKLVAARLATNISGILAMPVRSEAPSVISTLTQFMYISRLPTVLNQVQAMIACPFITSSGMLKLNWFTQSKPLVVVSLQSFEPE